MKQIVIIGGGYAGINAALQARKRLHPSEAAITLIDCHPYHLAYTYLYEVATSLETEANLPELKESVTVPIADVIAGTDITFVQAEVTKIDQATNTIKLNSKTTPKITYDYLVAALGSNSNFYGIPGAEEHAVPLKSVHDSFAIRNRIQFLVDAHREDMIKPLLRIAVAGGGFAGVEIAAELKGLLDFLAKDNNYPREKLEVRIIEGANQLMPGLGERVGKAVYNRLKKLGTEIQLDSLITKVDEKFMEFNTGERLEYDCIIWTAGIKARLAPFTEPLETDRGGRIITDITLHPAKFNNIFIAGDLVSVPDQLGKPVPATARHAIDQGKYIGKALASLVQGQTPPPYAPKILGYIVPLGGKWAIFKTPRFYMAGFLPYVFRQIAMFHYFYTIIGLSKAFKLSFLENKLYSRND